MEQDEYILFIDETGTAHPSDINSPYYILSGCIVRENDRLKLKSWAGHIKYKYWNDPNIVFHSREIGRKENAFKILRKKAIMSAFLQDLDVYFSRQHLYMIFTVVDKSKVRAKKWNDTKVYHETSEVLIRNFLCFLLCQGARGKIVVESATPKKDFYYYQALNSYSSNGLPALGITSQQVKHTITSISFVTKNNYDIEEQIADLLAYAARCRYMDRQKISYVSGDYELLVLRILKNKLVSKTKFKNGKSPEYLNHFDAFTIIR